LTPEEVTNILNSYPEKAQALIQKYKKREPTEDYSKD
jgi:hypothetical protein